MSQADEVPHVKSYTVALWMLGLALLLFAVVMHTIAQKEEEGAWAFEMVRNLELVLAFACFAVAALRSAGARAAGTATAGLTLVLSLWIPIGTGLALWWAFSVRKRESVEREST